MSDVTSLKLSYIPQAFNGRLRTAKIQLDFSDVNISASETVDIMDFPTYADGQLFIHDAVVEVDTVEGATATADFGIRPTTGSAFTDDPNGIDDAVNLNTSANKRSGTSDAQYQSSIDVTGGATLYMTADNALSTAVIIITVVYSVDTIQAPAED